MAAVVNPQQSQVGLEAPARDFENSERETVKTLNLAVSSRNNAGASFATAVVGGGGVALAGAPVAGGVVAAAAGGMGCFFLTRWFLTRFNPKHPRQLMKNPRYSHHFERALLVHRCNEDAQNSDLDPMLETFYGERDTSVVFGENEVSRFVYHILTGRVLTTIEQDHEHGGGLNANGARQGVAMSYNQLYPDDDEYNATNTGPVLTFQRTSARLRFIRRIAETDSTGGLLSRTKTIFHMQRAKYVILCFREFTANDIVLLCTVLLTYAFTLNLTQVFMVIGTYNKRKTKRHLLDEDNIQGLSNRFLEHFFRNRNERTPAVAGHFSTWIRRIFNTAVYINLDNPEDSIDELNGIRNVIEGPNLTLGPNSFAANFSGTFRKSCYYMKST